MALHHLAASAALVLTLSACAAPAGDAEKPAPSASPSVSEAPPPVTPDSPASEPATAQPNKADAEADSSETEDACGASKVDPWIGREATVPVRKEVVKASGAKADRWLYPDSVVTMDYSAARLNVIMEKGSNRIVSARCG